VWLLGADLRLKKVVWGRALRVTKSLLFTIALLLFRIVSPAVWMLLVTKFPSLDQSSDGVTGADTSYFSFNISVSIAADFLPLN
jgi:hypothetical protein